MNWQLEFTRCLEKHWLVQIPEALSLVGKELKTARDDLAEAVASYLRGGYKWSTIQTYYAMFHAGRALLYSQGYREKSHRCLAVALHHIFVSQGMLEEKLVDALDDARALREDADYRSTFSEAGARLGLEYARELVDQAGRILENHEKRSSK